MTTPIKAYKKDIINLSFELLDLVGAPSYYVHLNDIQTIWL